MKLFACQTSLGRKKTKKIQLARPVWEVIKTINLLASQTSLGGQYRLTLMTSISNRHASVKAMTVEMYVGNCGYYDENDGKKCQTSNKFLRKWQIYCKFRQQNPN